jgi:hypothetical protein
MAKGFLPDCHVQNCGADSHLAPLVESPLFP